MRSYLRRLPPGSPSDLYVLPVRILEVLLSPNHQTDLPEGRRSPLSANIQALTLRRMVLHLCKRGYFRSIALLIERQTTSYVSAAEAAEGEEADLDPEEFSRQPKHRAMLDLLQIPFQHYTLSNTPSTDQLTTDFLSAALTDSLSANAEDKYAVSVKISRLVIPTILEAIPSELLIGQLFTAASRAEASGRATTEGLRPTLALLHYFVREVVPGLINMEDTSLSSLASRQVQHHRKMETTSPSSDIIMTEEEPVELLWASTATTTVSEFAPLQTSHVLASLRIMAWMFRALMRARCMPSHFSPPFPPTPLQLTGDDSLSDEDDEEDEQDELERLSSTYLSSEKHRPPTDNAMSDFVPAWPSQVAEVFSGLQTCLPSLAFVALQSLYSAQTPAEPILPMAETIATLYYMLAFVKCASANSLIPLHSVLSQFPAFLSDLWHLAESMDDTLVANARAPLEDAEKWRPRVKLFDFVSSGEIDCLPPKIDRYTAVVLTFVNCLRHRLLCLTDVEISGEEDGQAQADGTAVAGCGFSPRDLLYIGGRLRDFMLGLISLAHPARRPSLDEMRSAVAMTVGGGGAVTGTAESSSSSSSSSSLLAVLERVQKRAENSIVGRPSFGQLGSSISRHSEAAVILRWELKRWSLLFCHVQRLVMLIFDWDRRTHRQLLPSSQESDATIGEDSLWLKPDCLSIFHLDRLPRWLRQADNCAVALAKAPFGYYSLLNPDKDDDASTDMSFRDWRQMTTLIEMPFVISFWRRVQIFQAVVRAHRQSIQSSRVPSLDFMQAITEPADHMQPVRVRVRRDYLYEDAFENLSKENAPSLRPRLNVVFFNQANVEEMGFDGGGLSREFLTEVIQSGFNPTRGYFLYTDDNTLYPNPNASALGEDYLKHYYFLGRMLGKALYEGMLVEIRFAHFFLAKLVSRTGGSLGFDYLHSLDRELYRQLCNLKKYRGNVRDLELDFTIVQDNFGESKVVELKPGGGSIPVTEATRVEYIHLVANYKLNRQIYPQSRAFIAGVTDVVYLEWLRLFDAEELQVLISGADTDISVEDLRQHTVYVGSLENPDYQKTVDDFWSILSTFSESQKRDLLRFATACSRPPMFGFRDLQPPFSIQIVPDITRLPTSSTCMNLLKLPAYADKAVLQERLLYALNSNAGFEYS
uniref:HECT-type E3 ubiquitin transferase n=1 Tax=Schistocephalus solidus TaxID=70667 RepID=A0A0X3PXT9_SCHSO